MDVHGQEESTASRAERASSKRSAALRLDERDWQSTKYVSTEQLPNGLSMKTSVVLHEPELLDLLGPEVKAAE